MGVLEGLEHMETGVPARKDGVGHRPVLEQAGAITVALARMLDDLGFETASAFVPEGDRWRLLDRAGPTRPWHDILDPVLLEGTEEVAEYPDASTVPGIGPRLQALGCAALAILPLPHGGRLILDGSQPPLRGGWVERARPYIDLLGLLWGPAWGEGSLQTTAELVSLNRLFSACQQALARHGATVEDVLAGAKDALNADELCLVSERAAGAEAAFAPPGAGSRRLATRLQGYLDGPQGVALERGSIAGLAVALGMTSRAVGAAIGRDGVSPEILVAGWAEGPPLSEVTMAIAARTVSTVKAAIQARNQAVNVIVDRERARMAYALHDDLTQTVTGAVLELEALRQRIHHDPQEAIAMVEKSKSEIRRALGELRAMLFDLAASGEERPPGAAPLTRYVEDLVQRWRLPARLAVEGDLSAVPARVRAVAYVVVREALANAAKHAGSGNVTVQLAVAGPDLIVSVGDTGRGFSEEEENAARNGHHLGLAMLRRRVAEVGGHVDIESRPGGGTRVVARLPIEGTVP